MESVRFVEELNAIEIDEPSLPEGLQVSRPSGLPFHQVHHSYSSELKKKTFLLDSISLTLTNHNHEVI